MLKKKRFLIGLSKIKFEIVFEKYIFLIFLLGIEIYNLIKLIIPFIRYNNLHVWDMFGHYFSAWYLKEFLWPAVVGWNPFFFFGFPQNQFYTPLYSYLSATLSFIFGLDLAFKLILGVALILMPISFYYFARKFNFSKLNASITMLVLWTILFVVPSNEHLGGNMHATFNVGLVTNAVALMLLFFYLGKLNESFETKKYLGVAVLFSLIILTHVFTAMVAAIAFIAFVIAKGRKKEDFLLVGKQVLLTFLLTAFWVVPFIGKMAYSRSEQIGHGLGPYLPLLFAFSIAYLTYIIYKKQKEMMPLAVFFFLLLSFFQIGDRYLHLQLHFYRFQLFFYLLIPVMIIGFFKKTRNIDKGKGGRRKEKINISLPENMIYFLVIISCVYLLMNVTELHPEGVLDLPKFNEIPKVDGRILIVASATHQPSPHIYQNIVPFKSGNYGVKGLFVESSPNSRYIFNLEREVDSGSLVWGSPMDLGYVKGINVSRILPYQLNLFNINYAFSAWELPVESEKIKTITFFNTFKNNQLERFFYQLYKVGDSSLVEVLDYKPRLVKKDWDHNTVKWFLTDEIEKGVLVNEEVPDFVGSGKEIIKILETSPRQDYLKFKVNSNTTVPILIKISQFPNWKAYVNGEKTKIYRASPYLMLVYGKGIIELKYKMVFVDYLGMILSLVGILFLGYKLYEKIKR